MRAIVCLPVAGSRFASGSSKRSTFTSSTSTPPSETRCFCPPESSEGEWRRKFFISTMSATRSTLRNISSCATASFSRANARSSATVRPMNCPSVSCKTVPTTFDMPKTPASLGSRPPTRRVPCVSPAKEHGINAFIQCASVDFPQPEGPVIRIFSPG